MIWFGAWAATPMAEVAATAAMEVAEVEALLEGVARDDSVLERMARPYEDKPWHVYRGLFMTPERISAGKAFAKEHQQLLARAEQESGVPAEVIVAILGVETSYGANMGRDSVVTSLYTLGFHHPRRGKFFRQELGHYLRLATDQGWQIDERKGSYAGAMGMGQFMPSSYRRWAVDFDGDERIDLFGSTADAIGSVANYLADHGWERGGAVLDEAKGNPARDGLRTEGGGRIYRFEEAEGLVYLHGHANFHVILTYNRSPLYARAVWELARAVEE